MEEQNLLVACLKGGFKLELLDQNERPLKDLTPTTEETNYVGSEDSTAQGYTVMLPKTLTCKGCTIRLLRQAREWGSQYLFWSCADVDVVPESEINEVCSSHGRLEEGRCVCDRLYSGNVCQYLDECWSDSDCGSHGKCVNVDSTTFPKLQCFCQTGWFGENCNNESPVKSTMVDLSKYSRKELSDDYVLYWRIIQETEEIEAVLKVNGTSFVALGWRPVDTKSSCKAFPFVSNHRASEARRKTGDVNMDDERTTSKDNKSVLEFDTEHEREVNEPVPEKIPKPTSKPVPTMGEMVLTNTRESQKPQDRTDPDGAKDTKSSDTGSEGMKTQKVHDAPSVASINSPGIFDFVDHRRHRIGAVPHPLSTEAFGGPPYYFSPSQLSLRGRSFDFPVSRNLAHQPLKNVKHIFDNNGNVIGITLSETPDRRSLYPRQEVGHPFESLFSGRGFFPLSRFKRKVKQPYEFGASAEPEVSAEPLKPNQSERSDAYPQVTPYTPRHDFHPMDCTDIVIGVVREGASRIFDYYTRDRSTPQIDSYYGGTDDLTAAVGEEMIGVTTILFRKKLKAKELTDHTIEDRLMNVIWARGQEPGMYIHRPKTGLDIGKAKIKDFYRPDELKYHGHGDQRGKTTMNFFDATNQLPAATVSSSSGEWKYPHGCGDQSCQYHVKWDLEEDTDDVRFVIQSSNSDKWTGIGFSKNPKMPSSDAVIGWINGIGQVTVIDVWLTGYERPQYDDSQDIHDISGEVNDGRVTLRFSRKRKTGDHTQDIEFTATDGFYFFFPVKGGMFDDSNRKIEFHEQIPVVSSEKFYVGLNKERESSEVKRDSVYEPDVKSEPEPSSEPVVKPQPEPTSEPDVKSEPEPSSEPVVKPQPEPTSEPDVKSEPEPTSEPDVKSEPEPTSEPDVKSQPEPTSEPDVKSQPEPTSEPDVKTEPEPTSEPDVKSKLEHANDLDVKSQPEPTNTPVVKSKPEPTSEPNIKWKLEPSNDLDVKSQPEPTSEPVVKSELEPTSERDVKSEPEPTSEPYVKSQPEPTSEPDAKSVPEPTSKPEVKSEPVPTSEPDIKSQPEPTSEPEVKSEPEPTSKSNVKPEPEPTSEPDVKSELEHANDLDVKSQLDSTNTPVVKSEPEPTSEPDVKWKLEPANDLDVKSEPVPTSTPVVKSEPEPTSTPVVKSEPEPTSEPNIKWKLEPSNDLDVKSKPEPTSEPDVKSQPEPTSEPEVKLEPEPTSEPDVKSQPESTSESNVISTPISEEDLQSEPGPSSEPNVKFETELTSQPDVKFELETTRKSDVKSESEPTNETTVKINMGSTNEADVKSDMETASEADVKSDMKTTSEADVKLDMKTTSEADVKSDMKTASEADVKSDMKTTSEADVKSDMKTTSEADVKSDMKTTRGADVKSDMKTASEADVKSDMKTTRGADVKSDMKTTSEADVKSKDESIPEAGTKAEVKAEENTVVSSLATPGSNQSSGNTTTETITRISVSTSTVVVHLKAEYSVEFKVPRTWKNELEKEDSKEYRKLKEKISNDISSELMTLEGFQKVKAADLKITKKENSTLLVTLIIIVLETRPRENGTLTNASLIAHHMSAITAKLNETFSRGYVGDLQVDPAYLVIQPSSVVEVEPGGEEGTNSRSTHNQQDITVFIIIGGIAALVLLVTIQAIFMVCRSRKRKGLMMTSMPKDCECSGCKGKQRTCYRL
ncbi:uncharacterized protein LOC143248691 isoform X2 [Tachypleus tridentatus]|uniref:uncharacterized protein LOC143248691 isoform X2 n=1 Tax=Tachypleus tridentatus TaxID=6853 RepID=UPI003FD625F2